MTTIEVTELGLSFDARRPPAAYAESGDVVRFTTPDTTFRRIESGEPGRTVSQMHAGAVCRRRVIEQSLVYAMVFDLA